MPSDVQTPHIVSGTKAFLAHLRDHPEARFGRPNELAERFGVSQDFVVRVLEKTEPQVKPHSRQTQGLFQSIYRVKNRLRALRDDAAKHPTTFVVMSTVAAEVVLLLLSFANGISAVDLKGSISTLNPFGMAALIPFFAVLLQMGLFFRKAMARYALFGALAFFLVGGLPLTALAWSSSIGESGSERIGQCLLIIIAHFAVSVVYGVIGAVFSFLGEYRRVLRENRRVERMTRQELLERLFQLEARMESARNEPDKQVRFSKVTTFLKPRLLICAAICGFLFRLMANATIGTQLAALLSVKHGALPQAVPLSLSASIGLLNFAAIAWLAYIAPNITTALLVGLLYASGETIAQLMNMPTHRDPHSFEFIVYLISLVVIPLRTLFLSGLAGIGAAIQTKTLDELNLQRNDEASLIAEQLKIQWRLAEHSCSTTVMVVDVVRSTQMKEGEPPLEVEYSFRRFQQWIEDISSSHGGTVTSTAGDGAVISFPSCHNAFLAATETQRRMPAFNHDWNRLTTRFRVRIGLHMGEVQGEIGKVQFAHVIDVAAHLQKVAPAGGVAVTSEIVASLGPSSFVPLAVKSDGHDVFLALNPSGM
jgi:class 3 adenylate cyclase